MSFGTAIILGIAQGLTEFLPVSSSGHLMLLQELFGVRQPGILLEVALHLGTLCSVFFYYRADIAAMLKKPTPLLWYLAAATLPAVAAALLLGDALESLFGAVGFLPFAFLITAAVMALGEVIARFRRNTRRRRAPLGATDAVAMGIMQAVAIVPGISRSGATVSGGLLRGLPRAEAARFSFLMSIPAILGSAVLEARVLVEEGVAGIPWFPLAAGAAAAGLSGYVAIAFMLRVLRRFGLVPFAAYTAVLGVALLLVL